MSSFLPRTLSSIPPPPRPQSILIFRMFSLFFGLPQNILHCPSELPPPPPPLKAAHSYWAGGGGGAAG